MLPVKDNQPGTHADGNCRKCGMERETQKHILQECQVMKTKLTETRKYEEIFKDRNVDNLQELGNIIIEIENEIERE